MARSETEIKNLLWEWSLGLDFARDHVLKWGRNRSITHIPVLWTEAAHRVASAAAVTIFASHPALHPQLLLGWNTQEN